MKHQVILTELFSLSRLITILLALLLVFCTFTSVYTVNEDEVGILRTFGKITKIEQPGIHFKLPYPFQQADSININKANIIEIGIEETRDKKADVLDREAVFLTSDQNLVWVNILVEWRIADPKAYLINAKDPDAILHDAIAASLRSVIGSTQVDTVLTDGRIDVQFRIKEMLDQLMDKYSIGIEVLDIKLQGSEPPSQVAKAFESVNSAREQKNILVRKAEDYKNQKLADVENEAKKMHQQAEAYYEERLEKATAEAGSFDALYNEYRLGKDVTRTRLLIETMEEVLPASNVYIMDDSSGEIRYLPVEEKGGGN